MLTTRGDTFWIKIQDSPSPVAGIEVESRILGPAYRLGIAPEPIEYGSESNVPFLVTRNVPGIFASHHVRNQSFWLAFAHAYALAQSLSGHECLPDYGPHPESEFGSSADPIRCLIRNLAEVGLPSDSLSIPWSTTSTSPRFVHGSLDARNIILGPDGAVNFLDWEAARHGPPAFDFTSFLRETAARPLIEHVPGGVRSVTLFAALRAVNKARSRNCTSTEIRAVLHRFSMDIF